METTKNTTKKRKQPRKRPLPPAVTRRNLAIEKRRRQDMNQIFLDLARCLPRLASTKRLSKNLIIMESVQHLQRQRIMCVAAGRELRELLSAHNNLIAEVNTLRSQLHMPVNNAPRPPSTSFLSLMDVENETYGEFPHGFAHPSTIENHETPPPAWQREVDSSLLGLSTAQDLVSPVPASTQNSLVNYPDATCDMIPPELWQAQMDSHLFSLSNVQDALPPDADWWGFDVSELNPETSYLLPSEDACNDVLHGHF